MNYKDMSVSRLSKLAKELGVYPEEGSGADGKVLKDDLLEVLKIGAVAPEEVAIPPVKRYKFDTQYRVLKEFEGHEPGAVVVNLPRAIGLILVEDGLIEEIKGAAQVSNPRAPLPKKER